MEEIGLIIEGGGMRGLYAAGVLDYFMEQDLYFKDCYAVSAGACHACSYLSKQIGRSIKVTLDYINDKRYCSVESLIKTGDMFGAKMLYDIIPNELNIYDYETYDNHNCNFYSVVTNCETGKSEYIKIKDMRKDIIAVRASSSLPLLSRIVEIDNKKYLDGGISDSIPIRKSIEDGHKKNIVLLTRDINYRKSKNNLMPLLKIKYKKYPNLLKSIKNRHEMYNDTLDFIEEERKSNNAFVIRPKSPVKIGRLEKDKTKLKALYDQGYNDAKDCFNDLLKFLNN
ncbi:patatin-like phospholipase family protein [Terrisporobacter sp.]|uniref:patatin-like phospholipase family protein n=1 Tax=Terrisporobacter sp. TaxID=1965305 RepID=UPI00260B2EB0|nr:patatin family protein [Terrisporobacter sp.]